MLRNDKWNVWLVMGLLIGFVTISFIVGTAISKQNNPVFPDPHKYFEEWSRMEQGEFVKYCREGLQVAYITYVRLAKSHYDGKNYEGASLFYQKARYINDTNPSIVASYAMSLYALGNYSNAMRVFWRAYELEKNEDRRIMYLKNANQARENYEKNKGRFYLPDDLVSEEERKANEKINDEQAIEIKKEISKE